MPKKVKFFSSDYLLDLETQVNEFLEEIDHYNIIDIKYNTCIGEESSSNYGQMIYTVMVLYIPNINRNPPPGLDTPDIQQQPNPILECNNYLVSKKNGLIGGPMIVETGKGEGV